MNLTEIHQDPDIFLKECEGLSLDEVNQRIDTLFQEETELAEMLSDDEEETQTVIASLSEVVKELKEFFTVNLKEKKEAEIPLVDDPLSTFNQSPFNDVPLRMMINQNEKDTVSKFENNFPRGFNRFEKRLSSMGNADNYAISLYRNETTYHAYYIKHNKSESGDFTDLKVLFAKDNEQFVKRLESKGITEYINIDFKKIHEEDAQAERNKQEYEKFRLGIDSLIVGNLSLESNKNLLVYVGESMTTDAERYGRLILKYYNQIDNDLDKRDNLNSGLKDKIKKINSNDNKITLDQFNKTVMDATIGLLRNLKSSNSYDEKEKLDIVIRNYYLNNQNFSKVLATVRQQIADAATNKQGVKA